MVVVWLSRFLWVGVVAVSAVGAVASVGAHAGTLLAVGDGWGGRWGRGRGWWGDRVEAQPNGRKYNHAGENTTASCLWAGPNGRNHNWLLSFISLDTLCRLSMVQPSGFSTKAGYWRL